MQDNQFWAYFWLVIRCAPALINVLALIATLVILLAAFIGSRR